MNNPASVLDSVGKYKEAEDMHRQTLALRGKVLGSEHPDTDEHGQSGVCAGQSGQV